MTIAKIAVSVAGGGPWLSFALDAFDTAYNVAAGNMSLKDGAKGLAKGAAITAVSSFGVGQVLGGAVGNTIANAGLGSVTASVASSMVNSYTTSILSSAINSFELDGGLKFNKDKFKQGAKDGLKGMAVAGLTSLVSSSILSERGARWSNGGMKFADGGGGSIDARMASQKLVSSSYAMAGMVSGIVGQTANYMLNGQFSLSFLNSATITGLLGIQDPGKWEEKVDNEGNTYSERTGDKFQHQNLLTLNLGKGPLFEIGNKGFDISMNALKSYAAGISYFQNDYQNDRGAQFLAANARGREGLGNITFASRRLTMSNGSDKIAWDIINGDKTIAYDLTHNGDNRQYGHADSVTGTIHLNQDALDFKDQSSIWGYTTVVGREGRLIDQNRELGISGYNDMEMRQSGHGAALTLAANRAQSHEMSLIANSFGVNFEGEWAQLKNRLDYSVQNGDLTGFNATGRNLFFRGKNAEQDNRLLALAKKLNIKIDERRGLGGKGMWGLDPDDPNNTLGIPGQGLSQESHLQRVRLMTLLSMQQRGALWWDGDAIEFGDQIEKYVLSGKMYDDKSSQKDQMNGKMLSQYVCGLLDPDNQYSSFLYSELKSPEMSVSQIRDMLGRQTLPETANGYSRSDIEGSKIGGLPNRPTDEYKMYEEDGNLQFNLYGLSQGLNRSSDKRLVGGGIGQMGWNEGQMRIQLFVRNGSPETRYFQLYMFTASDQYKTDGHERRFQADGEPMAQYRPIPRNDPLSDKLIRENRALILSAYYNFYIRGRYDAIKKF